MGTRVKLIVVLLVIVSLGWSALAWAANEEEEVVVLPAPVIAQAPEAVAVEAPAPEMETVGGVTQYTSGIAYYYNDRDWEVWITVGAMQGLRPGATVKFLRNGNVIASGEVKTVKDSDAIVTPEKGLPAGTIQIGDAVRVVENGTRENLDNIIAKEKRLEQIAAIGFGALIWGCIIIAR